MGIEDALVKVLPEVPLWGIVLFVMVRALAEGQSIEFRWTRKPK